MHASFTLVFIIIHLTHLVFNWRPLLGYFKDQLPHRWGFRWEWTDALCFALQCLWVFEMDFRLSP